MQRWLCGWTPVTLLFFLLPALASADPCGMVPPVYVGQGAPIKRVGPQKTYVFYKNGIESIVLRPGFSGKVDNFGMLIPFPTPPALRKMPDNIFQHVAAAIDPPKVTVRIWRYRRKYRGMARPSMAKRSAAKADSLSVNTVKVLRKEAMGMYQVAVLAAGSARALKRWMTRHGYRYPKGMDKVCEEYIRLGWCFVAVKTRVSTTSGLKARPGMRRAKPGFPPGGSFNGKVQAMGFRFRTKKLVVPMRLSAFNKGRLRNIVYILTDGPRRIRSIPRKYVLRQLSGRELYRNVTAPLPLRIIGGKLKDIRASRWPSIQRQRNPVPRNGLARNLFASDLEAVMKGKLALDHEEQKKVLLNISERLRLRGTQIDVLHRNATQKQVEQTVRRALRKLKRMTLTVVDGDFPRDVLARENLTFAYFKMPKKRNDSSFYNAIAMRPMPNRYGTVTLALGPKKYRKYLPKRLPKRTPRKASKTKISNRQLARLIRKLDDKKHTETALKKLIKLGQRAVPYLYGEAIESNSMSQRGWSIVALSDIQGDDVKKKLTKLYKDKRQKKLARVWAAAGITRMMDGFDELKKIAFGWMPYFPMLQRPLRMELMVMVRQGKVKWKDLMQLSRNYRTRKLAIPALKYMLKRKRLSTEKLLEMSNNYAMRRVVAPLIMRQKPKKLLRVLTTHKNNRVRRMAAAFLGTMYNKGQKQIPDAVVKAYRFRPGAKQVPWKGGALFIPRVRWNRGTARRLVGNLIRWYLWADIRGETKLPRQIHNNIRSLSLARMAGYRSPGWRTASLNAWLKIWGKVIGCNGLKDLLRQQKALQIMRYQAPLRQLNCQ